MNCQTEIDDQILNWEDEKVLPPSKLIYHMTAESPRILESTFLHLEVPGNLKSGSFSRVTHKILGENPPKET